MTYVNQEPGDEIRTAQIVAGEIAQHLKWKQSIVGDPLLSSQWTPARQAQFERWEQNVCSQIEMWQWTALERTTGAAVDEILRSGFLPLESETIQNFVRGLVGTGKPQRVAKRSR